MSALGGELCDVVENKKVGGCGSRLALKPAGVVDGVCFGEGTLLVSAQFVLA